MWKFERSWSLCKGVTLLELDPTNHRKILNSCMQRNLTKFKNVCSDDSKIWMIKVNASA